MAVETTQVGSARVAKQQKQSWLHHRRTRQILRQLGIHLMLIPAAALFLLPFIWMVGTSLKSDTQLFVYPPIWIPIPPQWRNYPEAVNYISFFLYLRNTLWIALMSTFGALLSCSLVAYSLARIPWPGRNILFIFTVATLMLPFQVTLIPLFVVWSTYGYVNTFVPLIAPHWFGSALYIFLLRQFFMTIPMELSEAARIDGAGEFRIYWRIILPLSKAALATVAIFEFIARWRDYLGPLIYLSNQKMYTLSLGIYEYRGEYGSEWALLMAASVLITLPIILLFFFLQKTFVQGIALTGIKG
jgi:multiple sugar transport system permease protein